MTRQNRTILIMALLAAGAVIALGVLASRYQRMIAARPAETRTGPAAATPPPAPGPAR